jgi:hypothetical protein
VLVLALAVLGVLSLSGFGAGRASAQSHHERDHDAAAICRQDLRLPIALVPGEPARYTVSGERCSPAAERGNGRTVQLLIPGATYDHRYWDFGTLNRREYSYARAVAACGYLTLAIDMPGTGHSSTLPSSQITIDTAAFIAHQAVQALRDGSLGVRFGKVIEVGPPPPGLHHPDPVALLRGPERGNASPETRADDHHVVVESRHEPSPYWSLPLAFTFR